jgi:hypothetical protein
LSLIAEIAKSTRLSFPSLSRDRFLKLQFIPGLIAAVVDMEIAHEENGPADRGAIPRFLALVSCDHNDVLLGLALLSPLPGFAVIANSITPNFVPPQYPELTIENAIGKSASLQGSLILK